MWMDAQFASLKALIVKWCPALVMLRWLIQHTGKKNRILLPERTDEELIHLGEGISGGVR